MINDWRPIIFGDVHNYFMSSFELAFLDKMQVKFGKKYLNAIGDLDYFNLEFFAEDLFDVVGYFIFL
jgi:hypothetical protein